MAKRSAFRIEHDSMGTLQVPASALWGAQTQRARENFRISGRPMPDAFVRALALVKASAAVVNGHLGLLDRARADAIMEAATAVAGGAHAEQFPVDRYQTGSGTSSNMNANEVIAHLAARDAGLPIHSNDHVNLGQSSNDVVPTAIRVMAVVEARRALLPALAHLRKAIDKRAKGLGKSVKTGRTHLMDAMPLSFAQELGAWSAQLSSAQARIEDSLKRVRRLPIGGTAIGTGINAHPKFGKGVAKALSAATGAKFEQAGNLFEGLAAQDDLVELSGQFNALAVALMKIGNDLRWMNSGPLAGLGEVELPALQPGSSIMPGKVNPVIPEVVNQVGFLVIGLDLTVTLAASAGQLQLNVMEPVISFALFTSISTMENAVDSLRVNCVAGITANADRTRDMVLNSLGIVTVLKPLLGYKPCAEIAREGYETGKSLHQIVVQERRLLTQAQWDETFSFENLINPKFEH